MDWMTELQARIKRRNQVLFRRDDLFLMELAELVRQTNRRALILWALELAEESARELMQRYPSDDRPQNAIRAAKLWASGKIKMPAAKGAILDCHAMAKELDSLEDIALCHAIGQAGSVVHTAGHAMGYPIYELTALVRRYGNENCQEALEARKQVYLDRLFFWQEREAQGAYQWASFLK
jgi:hypothetical protein